MNVALVQGPYKDAVYETISMPLGLCWISAYLKKEIKDVRVDGFDLLLKPELVEELYSRVSNNEFEVVGIQAHSDMTVFEVVNIINTIKKLNPKTKIIAGGNAATYLSDVLFRNSAVDIIIKGEGDITFVEIIDVIKNHKNLHSVKGIIFCDGNKIIETGDRAMIENLDILPLPDRSIFDRFSYPQYGLMMSRGCPYRCSFCSTSAFWKNRVRFRSVSNVIEEVKALKHKYNIKKLFVLDDSFGIDKKQCKEFLMKLKELSLNIKWACVTRADVIDNDILDLCKEEGCIEIHFGLDSANKKTQKLINKNLDMDLLRLRCKYAQKIGIRTKLSVILGLPGETETDIMNTVEFLRDIKPNEIQIYPLMPYAGTELFDGKADTGVYLLEKDFRKWKQDAFQPVVQSQNLSDKDIVRIAENVVSLFRSEGYKCIPFDMEPVKKNEEYIVKTTFAPLQAM